ncbi:MULTISPECIES: helix-turn-helix domain-containing protein [Streptomyces]|uniref:Regulator n=1 Tax=Streptomyces bottropensis ATCC 25435 TaxID=1054862 RepID=M3D7F4_9ACTN|nr:MULTISPECIES: helix-turn-helix domain-containing protein [Streptomyces]EMF52147.1 regulator [Streptomyces bottropensis ATCC 25435]MZD22579.1 regulator [Streptomyces sp. SID5476]
MDGTLSISPGTVSGVVTTVEQLPVHPALESLGRARELFLAGRQLPDGVPEEILAAWRRARFFGLRHDVPRSATGAAEVTGTSGAAPRPAAPPRDAVRPDGCDLLTAARPVLERLAPAVGTGRAALLLTDERPRVLWATGCAPGAPFCEDLSEQVVGNNSAALALRTRRRAEVHGPEHFLDLWQDVSAVSVPVLAPETGRAVGTVTVTTGLCADRAPHPWASLAEAAADAVEAELLARSQPAERVLLDAYLRASRQRGRAVVALDGRNRLVSEAAGRLLSPEGLDALERSVVALLRDGGGGSRHAAADHAGAAAPEAVSAAGAEAGMDTDVPVPASASALVPVPASASGAMTTTAAAPDSYRVRLPDGVRCSAKVSPVARRGSVIGAVAVLEPLGSGGAVPLGRGVVALAGRSVPWRYAAGRAAELARSPEPLLLVGERGTGKTALARELAPELLVVDAAEGELGSVLLALREGHTLLIRHVERLAQPDTATLNSLLASHPGTPLLATYTPGAPPSPCLQRLLDRLAARSVTLPALRERPEDIRELLTALAPKPVPGQPPLTWTLDALRALEQHPWPGNVTELVHLVRALAEQRRVSGPVVRAELPDPVREGPAARRLSPMERAERSAILEALRRNGGNKARAAASLGIARATLYRKLRGYRG